MDLLYNVANEIALEVKKGKWPDFNRNQQDPAACLAILTEFQNRAVGFELEDYVHALTTAIKDESF